jgi:hypothetical protein
LPKDIQGVGIAGLIQKHNPLAKMGERVGWIQAHRFVHLTHRIVEQTDMQVDEAELMMCLIGIRIESQRAPVLGNRAFVRELIPRLTQQEALGKMRGVEIRIDRKRSLHFDERPLLQRRLVAADVKQALSIRAGKFRVSRREPGIGLDRPFEVVNRLANLFGALTAFVKPASKIQVVGL